MKFELSVSGMTCGGCELHVESSILELGGVTSAEADHLSGKLLVNTDKTIDEKNSDLLLKDIKRKVSEAGYSCEGRYTGKSGNFSIKQWIGIAIILAALYLIIRATGIMNRLPVIDNSMGYGLIFIIGLMTSVHCIGMCGGINLSVSISGGRNENGDKSSFNRARPAFLYNGGRVVSYTVIGGVVGALGSVFSLRGNIQGIIVGLAGIFMLLMGLKMLGLFTRIDRFIPRFPKRLSARIMKSGSGKGPFIVGLLNGFIPCGPLQSVQIYALGTGSIFSGALSMFLFSLGTVPLMLGFGSISSILPSRFHGRILKVSALLVLLLGGGMILRGMSLNGLSFMGISNFNGLSENVRIAEINDEKQYVRTIMHSNEYEPFIVQAGLPVVWTIYAEADDLNGCNNPLTVPEYDIRFQMKPGENIIEFTPPARPATIIYTCWMGMITSGIKVVEDLNNIDASLISDTAALAEDSEGGCGECCSDDGSTGFGDEDFLTLPFPTISTENIGLPTMEEGVQILEVKIDKNGFDPSVLIMEKGVDTSWLLNVVELNELNYRLRFPAYNNQGIELIGGVNKLQFIPEFDFAYYSWKKDFGGFIKIVDDISSVNLDEIRTLVDSYNDKNNN